ncbi:MAG: phosphoenolpyruvate--protein phosphotransferase [Pseudonocardia sp. SCN 73-27]|uniref:phosphoenolpyruvate--protein phosphotransferase n=1 Tax=unclassified Pseudonocardia TaxID=2619320 RepID=UPI00086F3DC6|nr:MULTISPECIES: phosphoenolpyruvate--protein phosphotransferase [unclassified Pseudonocardia]ODU15187.1 MAG: phosphoenolpyruvate--protein phosphotransferase [Pseudonocardia sp. SCN 72-51]ODV07387.1 MAG: phosphoenolpyruvate--protein phosphotransferase [Pseudonocardia sp. SCN 73-27]
MTAPVDTVGTLVGIVVVSHSRALADAAVALAREMVHEGGPRIEVAAGLDETTFGTDAAAIMTAVAAADDGAGVVVLMDLGSAVLSAELALEMLDPDLAGRVVLCAAPLVEGLVAAVVTAAGGADSAAVAAEATDALTAKSTQLGGATAASEAPAGPAADGPTITLTLADPHGLHARPASRLVGAVRGLDADVQARNTSTGSDWAPVASLSRLATLGGLVGHVIEIRATGPDATTALDQLAAAAADSGLTRAVRPVSGAPQQVWAQDAPVRPLGASPGIAVGPARPLRAAAFDFDDTPADDPSDEQARLDRARADAAHAIEAVRDHTVATAGADEAAIFDAHLALLDDPDLAGDAHARIAAGSAAGRAWADAVDIAAARFAALPGEYLRARAADVRAVGDEVLRALTGAGAPAAAPGDGVLVAADLTPADAAGLDPATVTGVVLAAGSPTAHAAILLRAKGIPAVVGAGAHVLDVAAGTVVAVDGATGEVLLDPTPEQADRFAGRAAERADRDRAARARASEPATTRDGTTVLVGVNAGSAADAAAATGADLAGLVRTEFLFLGRDDAPGVDEQEAAYREVAAALGGRRITLRTLDVGGDKPLPYVPAPVEANPFLGVRGLRLALRAPDLFATQLRAIVRTAHATPVSVMFPMVSTVAELAAARAALDAAIAAEGRGVPAELQVGMMVEVPAAALRAAAFAPHVDFLSIGTNDLTQYALAAERGNDAVAALADPLDPAVLALVAATCRGAGDDVLVAVCGEVAADDAAAALLVGLGVRELSVAAPAVAGVKQSVRDIDLAAAAALADQALRAPDADTVRALTAG